MKLEAHSTLPPLTHKDRSIVYVGVIAVALVSWLYLINMAEQHSKMDMSQMNMGMMDMGDMDMGQKDMGDMDMGQKDMGDMDMGQKDMGMMDMGMMDMNMMGMSQSDLGYKAALNNFLILFLMWSVMMTAMMLPSILPATAIFTSFNQRKKVREQPHVKTYIFVMAYLGAWIACSVLFALTQSGLSTAGVLDSDMKTNNSLLSSGILILAGIYQWTPLKDACLKQCRSPLGFFIEKWREGHWGAVYMGWRYGLFCVGCCWALMAIMFSVGAMSILWMAMLSIFFLCEKIFPYSKFLRNIAGALLVGWGSYLLLS